MKKRYNCRVLIHSKSPSKLMIYSSRKITCYGSLPVEKYIFQTKQHIVENNNVYLNIDLNEDLVYDEFQNCIVTLHEYSFDYKAAKKQKNYIHVLNSSGITEVGEIEFLSIYKKPKDEKSHKVLHNTKIYDLSNQEISPGNVIAFPRQGQHIAAHFELYIVTSILDKTITLSKKNKIFSHYTVKFDSKIVGIKSNGYIKVVEPLFITDMKLLQPLLEAADWLKSKGYFPADYSLGSDIIIK